MSSAILLLVAIVLFIIAYRTYGNFISRQLGVNNQQITPSHTMQDGVDYVPTQSPVLLGHHFASIAGAGPIVGPIMAAVFGWVPVVLWIIIGGIFFGAVHDFASIVASARHQGKSIGEVIEKYIGITGKKLFLIFTWFTLILVIAVFARLVALTFITHPSVATASVLFIFLALAFGFFVYRRKASLLISTLIGILLLVACMWAGLRFPFTVYPAFLDHSVKTEIVRHVQTHEISNIDEIGAVKAWFAQNNETEKLAALEKAEKATFDFWVYFLLIYVFIAATTPVWILLQPRDYLNSFLLYALLLLGVVGVFFAHPAINLPAAEFTTDQLGFIFPILFVTVACGAISGFHSLVASGTTSKQLDQESDAKIIGYGGMLIESVLAVLALLAAATLLKDKFAGFYAADKFIPIFSEGVGNFIAAIPLLNIPKSSAVTFSALAVSAFALTSLDTCTRLARFVFQEFFTPSAAKAAPAKPPFLANRYVGTLISVFAGWIFIISGTAQIIWPVFGSANQLLAALALLAISVWLAYQKKKNWFVVIPMFFMFTVTLTALVSLIFQTYSNGNFILTGVAVLLFFVAIILVFQGIKTLFGKKSVKAAQA
jgi:carbon starvation protein